MKASNPITAPQIKEAAPLYRLWKGEQAKDENDFYEFITTPSRERDEFVAGLKSEYSLDGCVIVHNVQKKG
ncbi:MAG: hypothetical protein HDS62_08260 [Bacteroidales bacterium]|nr:hypothetical protein [Bacteroidales bacterium]